MMVVAYVRLVPVLLVILGRAWAAVIPKPKLDYGTDRLVANKTVYSAITVSDGKNIAASLHQRSEHGVHTGSHAQLEQDVAEILKVRTKNRDAIVKSFDFETFQWPAVNTHPCPHYPHSGHTRTERGFGLSHLQIWMEFYFFDHDIIDAMHRKVPEYITSNSYSSVSGIFSSVKNGSIYKNGIPFLDDDITVIFEDTAVWALQTNSSGDSSLSSGSSDHNQLSLLSSVLSGMNTDILSLGTGRSPAPAHSRHGRRLPDTPQETVAGSSPSPVEGSSSGGVGGPGKESTPSAMAFSTNAYAITRQGARRMAACYDHCGAPLDEQVLRCAEAGLVMLARHTPPLFDTAVDPV